MKGSLTYGPFGRLISLLAIVSAVIGALESSGYVALLPEKYKWIGLVVTTVGLIVAGVSERLQGGASKPEVRAAAATADKQNEVDRINQ